MLFPCTGMADEDFVHRNSSRSLVSPCLTRFYYFHHFSFRCFISWNPYSCLSSHHHAFLLPAVGFLLLIVPATIPSAKAFALHPRTSTFATATATSLNPQPRPQPRPRPTRTKKLVKAKEWLQKLELVEQLSSSSYDDNDEKERAKLKSSLAVREKIATELEAAADTSKGDDDGKTAWRATRRDAQSRNSSSSSSGAPARKPWSFPPSLLIRS
mmetsp:Transcript_1423/g.3641  ORF Transcript_1423/g.3641 Transcript_1423/m.3641 type:complete len:213 (-) Transcript_1423:716-1354(-)